MPISNNTTSISGHPIGVSPQTTGILRQLEIERSRANYQYRVKISEQKAMKLRQYAYKLVYRWTREEKLQLLQSYGDLSLVKNRNDNEEINRQLVETLLINLSEGELNSIVQQVNYTERELVNNIGKLNKRHDAYLDRGFTAATNPSRMSSIARFQSAGVAGQKAGFTASSNAFNISRILKKELKTIFKNYTKAQLGELANDLGIEFEDGDAPAYVQEQIIQEIGKYVALVTGKAKGMLNISSKTAKAAQKVLRLTSFAWTTGEKPLSSRERAYLISKAKRIKAEMDARSDIMSDTDKWYDLKKKFNKSQSDTKLGAKALIKKFEKSDKARVDSLRAAPFQDLLNRAAELGIYVPDTMTQDQIIVKIILKEKEIVKKQNKLAKKIAKALKKGNMSEAERLMTKSNAINKLQERSITGTFKPKGLLEDDTGAAKNGVPLVKLDDTGAVISALIDVAVPVVVVGQVQGGENRAVIEANNRNNMVNQVNNDPLFKLFYAQANEAFNKNLSEKQKAQNKFYKAELDENGNLIPLYDDDGNFLGNKSIRRTEEELISLFEQEKRKSKSGIKKFLSGLVKDDNKNLVESIQDKVTNRSDIGRALEGQRIEGVRPTAISVVAQGGNSLPTPIIESNNNNNNINNGTVVQPIPEFNTGENISSISNMFTNLFNRNKPATEEKPLEFVKSYSAKWKKGDDGHLHLFDSDTGKPLDDKVFFNKASRDLGFETIKRGPVTPVWIVNGFTEYLNNITEKGFKDLLTSTSAIYTYLSSSMPVLFQGLQQGGTAFNMAGPAAVAATVMENVVAALDVAFDQLRASSDDIKTQKYATGGTGEATKSQKISLKELGSYSQFMTGDSTDGKENTEMVSIDWNNRQFAVKPTKPTVSNVKKLSDNERLTAFGVSFREATVKYDAKIAGETEDNIALKVYPVTPGINDKVEINGKEISLIELISGLYGSVVNIEGILGQSLEVSKIIAAKPVGTVSSGGAVSKEETFPSNLDSILRGE